MFFESRRGGAGVAAPFEPALARFQAGECRAAHEALSGLALERGPPEALLECDVLRALGRHDESYRVVRRAAARHPDDPRLGLQLARVLSAEGRLLAAERQLDRVTASGPVTPALVEAVRTFVRARMGRTAAADEALGRLAGEACPFVRYEVGHALLELRRWADALAAFRGVQAECPAWARPWLAVPLCLAALGEHEEAARVAERAVEAFPEEVDAGLAWLIWLHARRDWVRLAEAARRVAAAAGPARPARARDEPSALLGVRLLESRARLAAGDRAGALAAAREVDPEWAARLEAADPAGARGVVALPPIRQDRDMCVAASLAMVLAHLGRPADPARLYAEMDGAGGITPWQLDRWLARQGLAAVDVAVTPAAVRTLVDRGVPLLATRSHVLMSHMEVVVGYDEGLGEVETLDPADGLPNHVPREELAETFGAVGEALVAVLPAERAAELPAACLDPLARAQRLVVRALHEERLDEARVRLAELPADGLAHLRLRLAHGDALTPPGEVVAVARAVAARDDVEPSLALQAVAELFGADLAEEGAAALGRLRARVSPFFRGYLRALHAGLTFDWPRMRRAAELLLERAASLPEAWHLLASALEGCGEFERARRARATCLELEPDHPSASLELLQREPPTLAAREARLRRLLVRHPRATEVECLHAAALLELGRPDEAERALRHALAIAPYSSVARAHLRHFFLAQGRDDLARAAVPDDALEPVAADAGALLAVAWDELGAERRREARREAPVEGRATAALLERLAAGRLRPHQAHEARALVAARLRDWATPAALEAVLPSSVPPPAARAIAGFLSSLPHDRVTPAAARRLRAWADGLLGEQERTSDLELQLALLDELAGRTTRSAEVYRRLAERGDAEAAFRLAVVALEGHDAADDARRWLDRALELEPAHVGGWNGLAALAARQGDDPARERALHALVRLRPYEVAFAEQLLDLYLDRGSTNLVRSWLAGHGHRYPEWFRQATRVRSLLQEGRAEEALAALGPPLEEHDPRQALALELEAREALAPSAPPAERRPRLEAALARFPDDPLFHHLLASASEPPAAVELYCRGLARAPLPASAERVVALCPAGEVVDRLHGAWRAAPAERRGGLVASAHDALLRAGRADDCCALLERVVAEAPGGDAVALALLVEAHLALGAAARAAPHARRLLALDPDLPRSLWLAARAVEPAEAIDLLRRYLALTGDPAAHTAIATHHQARGDRAAAIAGYRDALRLRAVDPVAIANLHLLGERDRALLDLALRALAEPPAGDVQHFAVAAVDLAAEHGAPLPPRWEEWAVERTRVILAFGGALRGEAGALRTALHVWCCARGRIHVHERLHGSRRLPPLLALALPFRRAWRARARWAHPEAEAAPERGA